MGGLSLLLLLLLLPPCTRTALHCQRGLCWWHCPDLQRTAGQRPASITSGKLPCLAAGMYHHLSLFYNERQLGPAYAKVASCTALAQVIGAPLAAAILAMDGTGGLKGW